MKDRLKKKLKAKKILGNKERNSSVYKPKQVPRKVYEMPPEYNEHLRLLTELLEEQERYEKLLPTLPPEVRAEAMPHIAALKESVGELEQKMADEYEDFQERQHELEKGERKKRLAGARLQEYLERMFIVLKHKAEPAIFEKFEKSVMSKMSFEDREAFYDDIALRESYDLENILANPNSLIKKPMKHPMIQQQEAMFEINRLAYETDDFFKEMYQMFETGTADRNQAEKNLWIYPPDQREKQRLKIEDLDRQREEARFKMMEYLEICYAEDGKVEIENPDQEKLDAAFEQGEIASERVYIMIKHTTPHLLEKYEQTVLSDYTPEEFEDLYARIAKREAKELDKILESVK